MAENHLEVLEALHHQVETMENREVMSPAERRLANAILVMLNVLIDERRGDDLPPAEIAIVGITQ